MPIAVSYTHLKRLVAPVDIGQLRARERCDDRPGDDAGDPLHRLEVAEACDREARLDVVHTEAGELLGDLEFLHGVERDAR